MNPVGVREFSTLFQAREYNPTREELQSRFNGKQVKVTGKLDKNSNTIEVERIEVNSGY